MLGCCSDEGLGTESYWAEDDRQRVVSLCLQWIEACDVVFCFLDNDRAFGTIFELGYAVAKGKPVFLAMPHCLELHKDAWFLCRKAKHLVLAANAMAAWELFVAWHWYAERKSRQSSPNRGATSGL